MDTKKSQQRTVRTSEGLRSRLFDTLDDFVVGHIDSTTAKTITKIADSLIKSVAVDIEYKRLVKDLARSDVLQDIADLKLNIAMVGTEPNSLLE